MLRDRWGNKVGNRKIICIVQARMNSERLPGKVLKPILGIPMAKIVLDRLSRSKYLDRINNPATIVLATTTNPEDDPLAQMASAWGYPVFRGDEKNVLQRYVSCVEYFGGDIVLRVTGDCPLVDPTLIDSLLSTYLAYDYDYMRLDVPNTFIRGFDGEAFSRDVLLRTYEMVERLSVTGVDSAAPECENCATYIPPTTSAGHVALTVSVAPLSQMEPAALLTCTMTTADRLRQYREHVTYFMYKHPEQFRIHYLEGLPLYSKPYRFCVDTPEDFSLVNSIFEHFNDIYISANRAVLYVDENTSMIAANKDIQQRL